jgi:ABC-type dipeptide/oligopeptide/nickel transport system permease subunit
MILFPARGLAALLMALNFIGDGLRDVFDPKSTNER